MQLSDMIGEEVTRERFAKQVRQRYVGMKQRRGWREDERAVFIRSRYPEVVEDVVNRANRAASGELILPGTKGEFHFVGDPPRWYENPVHDVEYLTVLNRMYHWKYFAQAYLLTGETHYRDKVLVEVEHWIDHCPRPELPGEPSEARRLYFAIAPWNLLCAGIRMFDAWPTILELLIDEFSPELLEKFAICVYKHGEALAEISPLLWPDAESNHYLMENLGLLSVANLFPEFRTSASWAALAIRELERCAAVQLTVDGGQIEGSPLYHNGTIGWFIHALRLASQQGLTVSEACRKRIVSAVAYCVYTCRPTGTTVPLGDSDADSSAMHAVLAAYAHLGCRREMKALLRFVGAEPVIAASTGQMNGLSHTSLLWELDDPEAFVSSLRELDLKGPNAGEGLPLVSWQRELHQVMLRTSWERDALSLLFSCRSPVRFAHQHIDLMGFDLTAYGRPLVVDPGRYTYREDEDRRLFKSSAWHNTLTINYREPFDYISSMRYGPSKPGGIEQVIELNQAIAAVAQHQNYEPVKHRRMIALVRERFVLVLDEVVSEDARFSVQLYYHLDSEIVTLSDDRRLAVSHEKGVANVAVYCTSNLLGELLPGKVSDTMDHCRASVRLCLREPTRGVEWTSRRLFATLLYPVEPGQTVPEQLDLQIAQDQDGIKGMVMIEGKPCGFQWNGDQIIIT